jgi:hypothetical protein
MPRNKLQDVRDHLIAGMEELLSDEPIDKERLERLKLVNKFGDTLVESAKAEALMVDSLSKMAKVTKKNVGSEFIEVPPTPQLEE